MMERQLGQMARLIDDLLDVSRISRGKIELRKERVELAAAVQQAVETSRPLIEQAGHSLMVICRPSRSTWTPMSPGWRRCSPTCSTTPPSSPTRGGDIRLTVHGRGMRSW